MPLYNDNNNNNNNVETELDMIEQAMNTMMKGTFSLLFKQLVEPSIFETSPSMTTTIVNGNNVNNHVHSELAAAQDEFGGNDFKRLAQKSKKNRGIASNDDEQENKDREMVRFSDYANNNDNSQGIINPVSSIMHLLLGGAGPSSIINQTSMDINSNNNHDDGWIYSSTSQRTVYQPDGSQETITTTKKNGVTETVRQIKYPDGRLEESREEKKSIWQRLWRG